MLGQVAIHTGCSCIRTTPVRAILVLCTVFAAGVEGAVLEEIVVTAQKREQSLQDVPLSIVTVSGDKISAAGIRDLAELSSYVPNLTIGRSAVNTEIRIRGIGSSNNRGFEQSVGMFTDGIYMGRGRQYRSPLFDVERVEVLRGPQGILLGKNTVAGAINLVTRSPQPGAPVSGEISARFEPKFGAREFAGSVEGAFGDNAAGRFAAKYIRSDGYVENRHIGRDEPALDALSVRGTLAWNVSDSVDLNLKVGRSSFDEQGSPANIKLFDFVDDPLSGFDNVGFGLVNAGLANPEFDSSAGPYKVWRDNGGPGSSRSAMFSDFGKRDERNDTDSSVSVLTIGWSTGAGTLTAVTGYAEYQTSDGADVDFLPIQLIDRSDDHEFSQFSQELRFATKGSEGFDYVIGAYFESQGLEMAGRVSIDGTIGDLAPIALGGAPTLFIDGVFSLSNPTLAHVALYRTGHFQQDAEDFSLFVEGNYSFTDSFTASLGLRYSVVEKEARKALFLSASSLDLLSGGMVNGPDIPLDPGDDVSGGIDVEDLWSAAFGTINHDIRDTRSENHLSPSIKLMWNATDSIMLFASYTEGFKAGGFNATDDLPFDSDTGQALGFEYKDEYARSTELGFKSSLASGAVRLNGNLYMTDFDDLQVSAFTGTSYTVGNAASVEVRGIEADLEWAASDNLRIGVSIAYLDHEYRDFRTAGCTQAQIAELGGTYLAELAAGTPANSIGASSGLCTITSVPATPVSPVGLPIRPVMSQDLGGRRGEYAPEWSGNVFLTHEFQPTSSLSLSTNVDILWSQEFFLNEDLDPGTLQGSYTRVNLRVGVSGANDRWEVFVFGNNLTDEVIYGAAVDTPLITGSFTGYVQSPRSVGAGARISF